MNEVTSEQVLNTLSRIKGADLKGDIVSLKMVENVLVDGGKVIFSINVPAERAEELEPLRAAAEKAVKDSDAAHAKSVQRLYHID